MVQTFGGSKCLDTRVNGYQSILITLDPQLFQAGEKYLTSLTLWKLGLAAALWAPRPKRILQGNSRFDRMNLSKFGQCHVHTGDRLPD